MARGTPDRTVDEARGTPGIGIDSEDILTEAEGDARFLRSIHNPQSPARSLDTPFQPSADRDVFATYSVNLIVDPNDTARVELRSDINNPPTTVRSIVRNDPGTDAGVNGVGAVLSYIVPAGHFVSLVTVTTGTPTISLDAQTERRL